MLPDNFSISRLIIFDCDGTLVDSEIIACKVFPKVWAEMGIEISEEFFLSHFVGTGSDAPVVKDLMSQLPANAMAIADLEFDQQLEHNLQPVAAVRELLLELTTGKSEKQICVSDLPATQICVASNSSFPYLQRALAKTALAPFFDSRVFSAHQVPRPKPAPDVFLHAAKSLGFTPQECIVVEDSVPGIKSGLAAGMRVVGFMGGLHFSLNTSPDSIVKKRLLSTGADHYVYSVAELRLLLGTLLRQ